MFWLEFLLEISNNSAHEIEILITEANELVAITVASIKTVRKRSQ